jgi:hypothetical protein
MKIKEITATKYRNKSIFEELFLKKSETSAKLGYNFKRA